MAAEEEVAAITAGAGAAITAGAAIAAGAVTEEATGAAAEVMSAGATGDPDTTPIITPLLPAPFLAAPFPTPSRPNTSPQITCVMPSTATGTMVTAIKIALEITSFRKACACTNP